MAKTQTRKKPREKVIKRKAEQGLVWDEKKGWVPDGKNDRAKTGKQGGGKPDRRRADSDGNG